LTIEEISALKRRKHRTGISDVSEML
jgi:hypothetical protein